jgi:hypothetical protein
MNDKEKFFNAIKAKGFDVSDNFFARTSVIPRHRKTPEGHHNIVNNITVVNFDGCNTKQGDLGCVTFACKGIERRKFQETENYYQEQEIIKKAFCPKSAKEAIEAYTDFAAEAQKIMDSWELIL